VPELGSIGDTITCADTGTGIANVTVTLIDADNVELVTQTDASGNYLFADLPAGSYTVAVDVSTLPDTCNKLSVDPDGGDDSISVVNLDEGEENLDQDFEYIAPDINLTASLGDYVWEDTNQDGIQDAGEPPVANVTVNLWTDDNADGAPDSQIDTTTTDADGLYSFTELDPDVDYVVQFIAPSGREFTTQNAGDDAIDSNPDSSGITPAIQLDSGENNPTIDAGLLPLADPTPVDATPTPVDATPTPSDTC